MGCCQSRLKAILDEQDLKTKAKNGGIQKALQITKNTAQRVIQEQNGQNRIGRKKRNNDRKLEPRNYLEPQVNMNEDFLTHHLKYELTMTKLTSMKRIRRRQILEHLILQIYWDNIGGINQFGINFLSYDESLISSWIQRTFLDIWEGAHHDLFVDHMDHKLVRRKVAEQFMFQLTQLKQFVDAGLSSLNFAVEKTQCALFQFVQACDESLFHLFKKLKDRYPQTSTTQKIQFPHVESTTTTQNLLNNFHTLCFSDPSNMNYQTIYQDLNFLFKKAIDQQTAFQEDMKDLLGEDVLSCPKVSQVVKDGKTSFNACAVRRVFVKWCQNLLERCPDLHFTKTFMLFIKAKSNITNNFFFKSTIQPTTHKIVLDCISLLLELAKFGLKTKKQREEFVFNIYDLLRCKIKRNDPQEIVNMLDKMKATKMTKSGKKFEVIRVKNRFETNNRDLLINFRYGDVLVGEAQLAIDNSNISKEAKHNHEFSHFVYELERSIFGPTLEIMMLYQDFQRPDITVDFEAQDLVPARRDEIIDHAGPAERKCLQGHNMITLKGNFFFPPQNKSETEEQTNEAEYPASCNYCDQMTTVQVPYDYCYHCGCFLCKKCTSEYGKADPKTFCLSIQRQQLLPTIKTVEELQKQCAKNRSLVVLFWLQNSSASEMFKDTMIYHQSKLLMQPMKYEPKIAQVKFEVSSEFNKFIKAYNLSEYPTMILLDAKANPLRTIIGFSWFETPNLYLTQKRIIEGKGLKGLKLYCAGCSKQKQLYWAQKIQGSVCLNCFGTSTPINPPQQILNMEMRCELNHARCLNCSYSVIDQPSTYKDPTGGQYLYSQYMPYPKKYCSKGHPLALTRKAPTKSWQFKCINCQEKHLFDNQHGVGECEQCQEYICSICLGANRPSYKVNENTPTLVSHYVQSTAQQACLCICQRHFKKVYCSRILSIQELVSAANGQKKSWQCFLCKAKGKDGDLHLACFACPTFTEALNQKTNFEICLKCASGSKMIMREAPSKVEQDPTFFTCPQGNHPMVETTNALQKELVIKCFYCKRSYFGHTQRIACKPCNINVCFECRQHLWKGNPPRCKQKCPKKHSLKFYFVSPKSLEFCDGCMTVMKDEGFRCEEDDYSLCSNCVRTTAADFIGSALTNLRKQIVDMLGLGSLPNIFGSESQDKEVDIDAPFNGYEESESGIFDNIFDF